MLNNTGVKVEHFGNVDQIMVNSAPHFAVGIVVESTGITADSSGRKIVKAGTPMAGDLDDRTDPFTVATESETKGTDAVGVLQHDVDVTAGDANGSLVLIGVVNTNMVASDVKTKITAKVKAALPTVKFIAL